MEAGEVVELITAQEPPTAEGIEPVRKIFNAMVANRFLKKHVNDQSLNPETVLSINFNRSDPSKYKVWDSPIYEDDEQVRVIRPIRPDIRLNSSARMTYWPLTLVKILVLNFGKNLNLKIVWPLEDRHIPDRFWKENAGQPGFYFEG